jgi:hypothetical protein
MADSNGNKGLLLSNRAYNILQQIALLGLPGFGTFYFAMAGIWGWDHGEQVVGSCTATGVFIGIILKMSQIAYNNTNNPDGQYDGDFLLGVTDDDRPNTMMTALNKYPEQFADQDKVVLKVVKQPVAVNLEPAEGDIPPVV